jgi:transcriptional regulator with XRE-family HTH domain
MAAKGPTKKNSEFSEEMLQKLAARFRHIRKMRGYDNYEKFANAFNINRSQYGRYEKGENLQFLSIVKVCRALKITLGEFFGEGFE